MHLCLIYSCVTASKHAPELLQSLYKALQHPVLCCRWLLIEGGELIGPSRDVMFLRLRRHTNADLCREALNSFHTHVVPR